MKQQSKSKNKITHFIVSESSRINRPKEDVGESFAMERKVKACGVKVVTLDLPTLDDSTDE